MKFNKKKLAENNTQKNKQQRKTTFFYLSTWNIKMWLFSCLVVVVVVVPAERHGRCRLVTLPKGRGGHYSVVGLACGEAEVETEDPYFECLLVYRGVP